MNPHGNTSKPRSAHLARALAAAAALTIVVAPAAVGMTAVASKPTTAQYQCSLSAMSRTQPSTTTPAQPLRLTAWACSSAT